MTNTETIYGPQTTEIRALLDRAGALTADEATRLHDEHLASQPSPWITRWPARNAARTVVWYAAGDEAREARKADRGLDWDTAYAAATRAQGCAVRDEVPDAAAAAVQTHSGFAADAARDAARGLLARHLIDRWGFTRAHYEQLTVAWRRAIGQIHPDDPAL